MNRTLTLATHSNLLEKLKLDKKDLTGAFFLVNSHTKSQSINPRFEAWIIEKTAFPCNPLPESGSFF